MTDEIRDASDPKQVAEAIKEAKGRDQLAREGLRQAMATEAGRAWLHRLLMWADPFRNPFNSDPTLMAFRCGEANIGQQAIADMHDVSPELYLQIMKENQK